MKSNNPQKKCKPSILKITSYGKQPFTRILNDAIRDPELGGLARAILAYALSMPTSWQIHSWQLKQAFPFDGRRAIRNAMGQLQDAGYARLDLVREPNGNLIGRAWMIRESPDIPWRDGK